MKTKDPFDKLVFQLRAIGYGAAILILLFNVGFWRVAKVLCVSGGSTKMYPEYIAVMAGMYGIDPNDLSSFVNDIIEYKAFDETALTALFPSSLRWKERLQKEKDLMKDLLPILKNLASGQEIKDLDDYEKEVLGIGKGKSQIIPTYRRRKQR
jgi:hypothetical protein